MEPVKLVLGKAEEQRARELVDARRHLEAAEVKLRDLQHYRQDYMQAFEQKARAGQSVTALRDFQVFLGRLEQAIQQQLQLVKTAKADVSGRTTRWKGAARQVKAVGSVMDRWRADERRAEDRQEQKETDERAQHGSARRRGSEAG